ncbi:MAG: colanic acid exporter [Candidatus Accumulibacter sp. BA-94]|nr:MAG: colanic acid exporter [Candidatus Accumulibacter sp. BA-94]
MPLFAALRRSEYLRQVSTLLSGSFLAQLTTLLAAPLLTRSYSPQAFGTLALLVAIVAALAPGVAGRYETAVVVSAKEEERCVFFHIALWITTGVCSAFALALLVGFDSLSSWMNAEALGGWLWTAPLLLWFTGAIAVMQSWANAEKNYAVIGRSMILQTVTVSVLAIGFSLYAADAGSLILANLIGPIVAFAYLAVLLKELFLQGRWRWDENKSRRALANLDLPLYSATSSILNGFMTALPVFFLAKYFSDSIVGYYALLVRVGAAPLSFLSQAVSRVNFQRTSEIIHSGGDPTRYVVRSTLVLAAIALTVAAPLMMFASRLFELVFGSAWGAAGELLTIIMPALAVQFVVSTLSMSFVAVGHVRLAAAWQLLSLIVTVSVFSVFGRAGDVEDFFWAFMMKDVSLYLIYYAALIYAIRNRRLCIS